MRAVLAAAVRVHFHLVAGLVGLELVGKVLLAAMVKTAFRMQTHRSAVAVAVLLLLVRLAQALPGATAAQVLQVQSLALR